jgi:hypothetical protein
LGDKVEKVLWQFVTSNADIALVFN